MPKLTRRMPPRRRQRDAKDSWITRWGVVVAAVVAALGAITVGILNLASTAGKPTTTAPTVPGPTSGSSPTTVAMPTCQQDGALTISAVTIDPRENGGRAVLVEGTWTGRPIGGSYAIYAVARPADRSPVGGTLPTPPGAPQWEAGSEPDPETRNWYVAKSAGLDVQGKWSARITIDKSENRKLVVHAICAQLCPPGSTCGPNPDSVIRDMVSSGIKAHYATLVSPAVNIDTA